VGQFVKQRLSEKYLTWEKQTSIASGKNVRPTQTSFIRANQPTLKPEPKGSGFFNAQ